MKNSQKYSLLIFILIIFPLFLPSVFAMDSFEPNDSLDCAKNIQLNTEYTIELTFNDTDLFNFTWPEEYDGKFIIIETNISIVTGSETDRLWVSVDQTGGDICSIEIKNSSGTIFPSISAGEHFLNISNQPYYEYEMIESAIIIFSVNLHDPNLWLYYLEMFLIFGLPIIIIVSVTIIIIKKKKAKNNKVQPSKNN